eukprot:scaffold134808_cov19-Tisochrysis_lutea.AAC.2
MKDNNLQHRGCQQRVRQHRETMIPFKQKIGLVWARLPNEEERQDSDDLRYDLQHRGCQLRVKRRCARPSSLRSTGQGGCREPITGI